MPAKSYTPTDLAAHYGRTVSFGVIDTIGVPHPYTIGLKHIKFAADHCGGILDERTLNAAGMKCAHRGCKLAYNQHETALLVECLADPATDSSELKSYLESIVSLCEEDGFAGFTLLDKFSEN